mmetsp:Transcript_6360/g.10682  ORF Transcript_6360/g.10682 Transcript_6360/m.10682 type:complete len:562 (-) Transcript_6360:887-2572(-)|eukprot:CAMPEP_0175034528 /NCGR_PEP_ID=MMETSP0005-20121125/22680_1 /TAXON_ID=420556 /ORGANISM="Ochromonas sp., Strain CCMP1393" /LENGTH=561 /DNA_ID=CAMNT_0016295417 /DNA_START=8 /DNA_END=1693 /DNA_ORIENTATION=-
MASISVSLLANFKPAVTKRVIAIASSVDHVHTPLKGVLSTLKVFEPEWLDSALSNLKPQAESPSTIDFMLPSTATGADGSTTFIKFVVALLPTACSRHNAPSNAHAVSSVVKANKGGSGDNTVILVVPAKAEYAFSQACAAGRCFPLFSMKNLKSSTSSLPATTAASASTSASPIEDSVQILVANTADQGLMDDIATHIDSIRLAQRLVDAPPNVLHVDSYIAEARQVAAELGCEIKVIQGKELEAGGFGGLWGVGKASEHPPALVILSYYPPPPTGTTAAAASPPPPSPSICMVGKGIVYDTGGLSIKTPTTSMAGMKMDMGGSAAVLGAFAAAVKTASRPDGASGSSSASSAGAGDGDSGGSSPSQQLTAPLHALLCMAENAVDERSIRPDDVLTFLSGKTVEVNNTDAEGRLVLADGCVYASKHLNPGVIVDIATLTGAQLVATGKKHAALYCSDEELEQAAVQVGKFTADLTYPLPYCPEFYKPEFASKVADMKNSVKDRGNAQSSCAGQFIGNHLEEYLLAGGKWLHVDMAGPAMAEERATGFGVLLLSRLVKHLN